MQNRWQEKASTECIGVWGKRWGEDLALRTYTGRLIGTDPELVLHGGGNTSVKSPILTVLGEHVPAIFVKASGYDLATLVPEGHTGLDLT